MEHWKWNEETQRFELKRSKLGFELTETLSEEEFYHLWKNDRYATVKIG